MSDISVTTPPPSDDETSAQVGDLGDKDQPRKFETQARALEVVYKGHIIGERILGALQKKTYGLYKAFVKWHSNDHAHTHVGLILREKPKLRDAYGYFTVKIADEDVRPTLVASLGKGHGKPLKKLAKYVGYLTDGHDNGNYKDTWNYKYDHELDSCKTVQVRVLCLMTRGQTFDDVYKSASWDDKYEMSLCQKKIYSAYYKWVDICRKPAPLVLREWQSEVVDMLKTQNDREILWIYDKKGNNGKTVLCKQLSMHHGAAVYNNAGKKDISYAYDYQPIVAFNLTRTTQGRVNYEVMESLKDGLLFSSKYESTMKVFTPPKLVVMSNSLPDFSSMSEDRWKVLTLDGGRLLSHQAPQTQETPKCAFVSEDGVDRDRFDEPDEVSSLPCHFCPDQNGRIQEEKTSEAHQEETGSSTPTQVGPSTKEGGEEDDRLSSRPPNRGQVHLGPNFCEQDRKSVV